MEKVTNKEVLSRLDMKITMLLQKAKTLKLKYFGHIKRHETLERHILEARIDGRRGRRRPTRRWEQDINDWMDMTTTQAGSLAEGSRSNVSPRDKLIKKKKTRFYIRVHQIARNIR